MITLGEGRRGGGGGGERVKERGRYIYRVRVQRRENGGGR